MDNNTSHSSSLDNGITSLANECGILPGYLDMTGQTVVPSADSVLALARSMDVQVNDISEASGAAEKLKENRCRRVIEPVLTAWSGQLNFLTVKTTSVEGSINACLTLENGEVRRYVWNDVNQFCKSSGQSADYLKLELPFTEVLPWGYHQMCLDIGGTNTASLIISAPFDAFTYNETQKPWGLFCPLYALRSSINWGIGDLGDLRRLTRFCSDLGGEIIALLPLLPVFLREHFNPSPYSPVSREFWNELYIEPAIIPELSDCPEAVSLLHSVDFQQKLSYSRSTKTVDYHLVGELKRSLLEILAEDFFHLRPEPRWTQFTDHVAANPDMELYARFRAFSEEHRTPWPDWPQRQQSGLIEETDCCPETLNYYRYSQFVIQTQLADTITTIHQTGQALYLDLPLGVHPDGFDAWRDQTEYLPNVSVGAPPDPAFPSGQDWGFKPPHPIRQRENGYRSFIKALRHHLKFSGALRLDHIMGLHRLFCIPSGKAPSEGVYLRYNAEEIYAILCLESRRHNTVIIGEDLGLVPPEVRPMMDHHRIHRSYIAQYEIVGGAENTVPASPRFSAAALNTHDLPPFAAFWNSEDIPERLALGVLTPERAEVETALRLNGKNRLLKELAASGLATDLEGVPAGRIGKAVMEILAQSPAPLLLINLADLWDEHQSQNIPGTTDQRANWRIKTALSLEKLEQNAGIRSFLMKINEMRKSN
ncbi:MAG: 4-alpha-glucanotransferase [Dehalogenimonas sp.]|uniref:4-alpha-glucanotransferase n=1 Tax=Candidatus Dehalogenimonas loeffleri TaxID=3127115 RepID=A0ABZ2J2M4_9CHLR|nr:4-alpha-glucanotransferase [Dehalogenimonas sp.]